MSLSSRWAGKIAQLAGRQYGHVTRAQLLALGIPSSTIAHWVATGGLIRVHIGVYAVGYPRVEPVARAMAAVLAAGPGAVLSHDSALALWALRRWPRQLEVTVPRCVRRPGITAHRSRTLTPADTTVQLGVPVTRAARAIDDTRSRLTERQYIRLVNDARLQRLISADEAAERLGHGGNPTRSGLEDSFQRWITGHRIPQPLINAHVTDTRSTRSGPWRRSSASSTTPRRTATPRRSARTAAGTA
jgi:hypothetical protein